MFHGWETRKTRSPWQLGMWAEGRRIVERQRKLIAEGRVGPDASAMILITFERSQEIFESDLDRLLQEQGRN
jgi:hypothetical protein